MNVFKRKKIRNVRNRQLTFGYEQLDERTALTAVTFAVSNIESSFEASMDDRDSESSLVDLNDSDGNYADDDRDDRIPTVKSADQSSTSTFPEGAESNEWFFRSWEAPGD